MNEENKRDIHSIKEQFNTLRNILNEKQKQFQRTLQNYYEGNAGIVKGEVHDCDKTLQQHGHVKKNIDTTMRKDDLSILQDYNKREK